MNVHTFPESLDLGDMTVVGRWPAKMMKALAVIADKLHPALDDREDVIPGKSKECCILCALTIRDFLNEIGFEAGVRSVTTVMQATENDKALHSVGIGAPPHVYGISGHGHDIAPGRWDGHLVTVVPKLKLLIDATLYQTQRPAWDGVLKGMIALPYGGHARHKLYRLKTLAGIEIKDPDRPGYNFALAYLDRPDNQSWKRSPDVEEWRRHLPVIQMRERFGTWHE